MECEVPTPNFALQYVASRLVLEDKLKRKIRRGYFALHSCDTPRCLEPAHLYEGTKKQNARDRYSRGRDRHLKGAAHARAVLTQAFSRRILKSDAHPLHLAKHYKVSVHTIYRVLNGTHWTVRA